MQAGKAVGRRGTEVQELVIAAGVGSGNRVVEGYSYVFAATVRRADGVTAPVPRACAQVQPANPRC
jgi:hypothetical protein